MHGRPHALIVAAGRRREESWRRAEDELAAAFLKSQGLREPFEFGYPFQDVRDQPAGAVGFPGGAPQG